MTGREWGQEDGAYWEEAPELGLPRVSARCPPPAHESFISVSGKEEGISV